MPSTSRNDPRQYDDLADQWWRPGGGFELLHWLASARAALIPPAQSPGAILVDAGSGAGLLAPHVAGKGYVHVGVDLRQSGLKQAATHGVRVIQGDVTALPLASASADVVAAGEILEHVTDLPATVAEICRVLRPGGLVVLDTLNNTLVSRFVTITAGEAIGVAPKGLHDGDLFVDPRRLTAEFARHGVRLEVRGARPGAPGLLRWLLVNRFAKDGVAKNGRPLGRVLPTRSTAVLYQGRGRKEEEIA